MHWVEVSHVIEWAKQSYWMNQMFGDRVANFSPAAGDFAAAWIITKFTEPIRLPLTAYLTPKIAKFIQKKQIP
jgi:hypothetical protein